MSEEFDFAVRFSIENIELLEAVMEHLDMHEHAEAQVLLQANDLNTALQQFDALISEHSYLAKQQPLSELFTAFFNDNVNELDTEYLKDDNKWRITGEGFDQTAFDFMACLIMVLLACGATHIQGAAQSDVWQARWLQDNTGSIEFNYKVYEGEE